MQAATEISRDPPGYPDQCLYRNYRYFMNQTRTRTRTRSSTRLPVIEPILTGVGVFAANGISTHASFRGPPRSFFFLFFFSSFFSNRTRASFEKRRGKMNVVEDTRGRTVGMTGNISI